MCRSLETSTSDFDESQLYELLHLNYPAFYSKGNVIQARGKAAGEKVAFSTLYRNGFQLLPEAVENKTGTN